MIRDLYEALTAALSAVDELRVAKRPGDLVDPPGASLSLPVLSWDGYTESPTNARLELSLFVQADDRALDRMEALLGPVRTAIESVDAAVVTTATPGTFLAGSTELPAYLLTIEVAL